MYVSWRHGGPRTVGLFTVVYRPQPQSPRTSPPFTRHVVVPMSGDRRKKNWRGVVHTRELWKREGEKRVEREREKRNIRPQRSVQHFSLQRKVRCSHKINESCERSEGPYGQGSIGVNKGLWVESPTGTRGRQSILLRGKKWDPCSEGFHKVSLVLN